MGPSLAEGNSLPEKEEEVCDSAALCERVVPLLTLGKESVHLQAEIPTLLSELIKASRCSAMQDFTV